MAPVVVRGYIGARLLRLSASSRATELSFEALTLIEPLSTFFIPPNTCAIHNKASPAASGLRRVPAGVIGFSAPVWFNIATRVTHLQRTRYV